MKVPNAVVDYRLSPNAMKTYIYLLSCQNALGTAIVKTSTICSACAISSKDTVLKAVAELESKSLVVRYRRKNAEGNFIANGYYITQLRGGWFMLDTRTGVLQLPKASFATYIYLKRCANRKNRAFPSINKMATILRVCRNTIIAAIKDLVQRSFILKAILRPGKHNLYRLCEVVGKMAQKNDTVGIPCQTHETENQLQDFHATILTRILSAVKGRFGQACLFLKGVVQKLGCSISTHLNRKEESI